MRAFLGTSSATYLLSLGFFVLAPCIFVVTGCGSAGTTQAGDNADGDQDVQQVDDSGATPSGDTQAAEDEAITEATIDAAEALAISLTATIPSADLQSVIESGYTLPGCPSLTTDLAPIEMQIKLDYGTGCNPALFPDLVFAGAVQGTAYIAVDAFELSFDELSADELLLDGTIAGGFTRVAEGTTEFAINADLTLAEGAAITATGTAEVVRSTGIITIREATVTSIKATGEPLSISFADLLIDPITHGNFIPASGTAVVTLPAETPGHDGVTIMIEFTQQTPVDGTVYYTVDI